MQVASWLDDPCGITSMGGREQEPYVMCDLGFDNSWVSVTKVTTDTAEPGNSKYRDE